VRRAANGPLFVLVQLATGGIDGAVLEHQVEVLGEAPNQPESLGEARATLEPELEPALAQRPQAVRDPIVLLDECGGDARLARDDREQLCEVRIVVDEAHAARVFATHLSTKASVAFVP
jgi:hypothetical protein